MSTLVSSTESNVSGIQPSSGLSFVKLPQVNHDSLKSPSSFCGSMIPNGCGSHAFRHELRLYFCITMSLQDVEGDMLDTSGPRSQAWAVVTAANW